MSILRFAGTVCLFVIVIILCVGALYCALAHFAP